LTQILGQPCEFQVIRGPLPPLGDRYAVLNGVRRCRTITAVFALTDTVPGGGYAVLLGVDVQVIIMPPSRFH
jgi:hypothetical protein